MKLELKIPDTSDRERVMQFRRDFLESSPNRIPGAASLVTKESYQEWLDSVHKDLHSPDEGRVRATQYIAIDRSTTNMVGAIQLRHSLNNRLLQQGGHIGYCVHPDERRKGYGAEMLRLCLAEASKLGIENVLLTCDVDNIASAGVIEKCGGKLEDIRITSSGIAKKRFWIAL